MRSKRVRKPIPDHIKRMNEIARKIRRARKAGLLPQTKKEGAGL